MLGCQDFCGYYDWTFHYIRRRWGNEALRQFMAEAIAGDSQSHYSTAAASDGLRGLLQCWDKTGGDEQCDWTFTLDEERNVLRWDMRQCPSKGFLLNNDLNADEDYCDHCMGWIVPLLDRSGIEVVAHEHNHCGQCWAEMRVRGQPYQTLSGRAGDIQLDPRWQRGFVDRWRAGVKQPVEGGVSGARDATDPCDVIVAWLSPFARAHRPGGDAHMLVHAATGPSEAIVTANVYASRNAANAEPLVVIIDDRPDESQLQAVAQRFNATPPEQRPLLTCAYLPDGGASVDFLAHGIPRPIPILPLLIRAGLYNHKPGSPHPTSAEFAVLLASAFRIPAACP